MAPPLRRTTLGGLALAADGRALGGAVGQRRPLAVLALLAAVRKRVYLRGWPRYLATALREEGRLALAVGDSAGALRADER